MKLKLLSAMTLLPAAFAAMGLPFSTHASDPWSWSLLETHGSQPGARQGHAAVEVGRKIYVIGGCIQEIRCYNDVYVFDTGSKEWSLENVTGEPPEPRGGHTATLVGTDIFVVGGANSEKTFGDVHRLDLVQRKWRRFSEPRDGDGAGLKPVSRTSHAAAVDGKGRLYLFGGYDADGNFLNDLWILHASQTDEAATSAPEASWAHLVPTGDVPAAREGHSLTFVDQKLLLFGGYVEAGQDMNDVHMYDIDAQQWKNLDIAGSAPHPRQAHSAARHGHDVIVAGGCDVSAQEPTCFDDVWSLSLADMRWIQKLSAGNTQWKPREGHTASFVGGRMFSFGGCRLGAECFADVSALDTLDPCPSKCGGNGQCMDGLYCKCTTPGFTGHDCMQPLTCKMDCGLNGGCGQDGQCACKDGWSGATCSTPPSCPGSPLPCSGRGECLPGGRCQCQPGTSGLDCFEDAAPKVAVAASASVAKPTPTSSPTILQRLASRFSARSDVASSAIDIKPPPPVKNKTATFGSLIALNMTRGLGNVRAHKVARITPKGFGIDAVAEADSSDLDCEDNCHWRGLCEAGTCYCQPGYSGKSCAQEKEQTSGTISVLVTGILAGATLILSLLTSIVLLNMRSRAKRMQERDTGYNV